MIRKIIKIDETLCDGCGECMIGCSEGAINIIDGKARLVKEEFCDGFGDCLKECPQNAITIEERLAIPFDEQATKQFLLQTRGLESIWKMEEAQKRHTEKNHPEHTGCPGSQSQKVFHNESQVSDDSILTVKSRLTNWPIQISLIPVQAPFYENADLLIAADCCSFSYGNFHNDFITNHITAIGCPKLDNTDFYNSKISNLIQNNNFKSIKIAIMEVPCCFGLVKIVENAVIQSGKKVPIEKIKISVDGKILNNKYSEN